MGFSGNILVLLQRAEGQKHSYLLVSSGFKKQIGDGKMCGFTRVDRSKNSLKENKRIFFLFQKDVKIAYLGNLVDECVVEVNV